MCVYLYVSVLCVYMYICVYMCMYAMETIFMKNWLGANYNRFCLEQKLLKQKLQTGSLWAEIDSQNLELYCCCYYYLTFRNQEISHGNSDFHLLLKNQEAL